MDTCTTFRLLRSIRRLGRPDWLRMHDTFTVAAEAYGNAAGRFSGAWQRGAATVGRNILKADEQAMRDRGVAAGKQQEGVAMVSAAAVWLNAQQRYADTLVRR